MNDDSILLDIKDLSVRFHTDAGIACAVNHLNLSLGRGKALGLVGETGAGKSTTALAILQLIQSPPGQISSGTITYNGQDLMGLTQAELRGIRGKEIAMIFQDPMTALNPTMRVEEQIMEMVMLHSNVNTAQARERAREMLSLVGIRPERGAAYPHQFSGGMKQRVCIAIALACRPSLLIADEPTTALDVTIQAQIIELIKELQRKANTALLLITHDLGIVAEVCDSVAIMYAGCLVESGPIERLFNNPLHPYTRGLFRCVPELDSSPDEDLAVIQGLPPDPIALPAGCSFSPRCEYADERCHRQACGMREVEPGHFVDCYLSWKDKA